MNELFISAQLLRDDVMFT